MAAANDLDLDELHAAVNALMDDAKAKKTKESSSSAPQSSSVPVAPESARQKPVESAPEPPLQGEQINVRRPLPTVAPTRPRGRAMDVIGRKAPPKISPPSVQTKRQAPALQPTGPVTPEAPKPQLAQKPQTPGSDEPADALLASIDMKQEPHAPTLTHQKSEWPDPLDVHGFTAQEDTPKPSAEPELEPVGKPVGPIKPDPDDARPHDDPNPEESNSPFVTTKVEKRPLGAYADAPPAPPLTPTTPAPKEELEPAAIGTQQPREFSPEVVAVESAEPEFRPDTSLSAEKDETDMQELRQMSIPQQYKQAEKTANHDSRPVFDTREYHPPIVAGHAAHRSNSSLGWMLILIFTILLVIALVAAYYMITGSLDITQLFA